MYHNIEQLIERQQRNFDHNLSFESGELIAEVEEELSLYEPGTHTVVWCDPKDNFVKDYYLVDMELVDEEERRAARDDKETFLIGKHSDDLYMVTLSELLDVLKQQSAII